MRLAGLLIIRDEPGRRWRAARREIRRIGPLRFVDVAAFRAFARLFLSARDEAWKRRAVAQLRNRYAADLDAVPRLVVSTPNSEAAREFIAHLQPDIVIARCKVILRREVFELPRVGTFVLHPGICPEYRNAHGCFWALANRDLTRVGMTLLRVDAGIDTGPVYLHATCDFDEVADSHAVIQYRAVLDNLEAIGRTLVALHRGENVQPVPTRHRRSAEWGQPQLTKYLRWKRAARRLRASTPPGAMQSERGTGAVAAQRALEGRADPGQAIVRSAWPASRSPATPAEPALAASRQKQTGVVLMRAISLLFHDVYVSDPAESGFVSRAANRYKLSLADFEAQLENIARLRDDAPLTGDVDRFLSSGPGSAGRHVVVSPGKTPVPSGGSEEHDPPCTAHLPYTITFDDGGVSYYTLIADRLEARGWRGCCFVTTDYIGCRGFLDVRQIRDLHARGHLLGSHSASHPARLSALPFAAIVREWRDSRMCLEDLLGRAVHVASVPGGYFSAAVARAAREAGLTVLFTSEPVTTVKADSRPALLGRFTIRDGAPPDAAMRFVAAAPWMRSAAWVSWNAKGLVKPLLGPAYRHVADWVCALRRGTPPSPATRRAAGRPDAALTCVAIGEAGPGGAEAPPRRDTSNGRAPGAARRSGPRNRIDSWVSW